MRRMHGFAVMSVEHLGAKGRLTWTRARLLLTTLYCSRGSSICPVLAWVGRAADVSPLGTAKGVPPPWRPQQVSGGPPPCRQSGESCRLSEGNSGSGVGTRGPGDQEPLAQTWAKHPAQER